MSTERSVGQRQSGASVTCGDLFFAYTFRSGADVGGARRWKHVTDLDSQTPPTCTHSLLMYKMPFPTHACSHQKGAQKHRTLSRRIEKYKHKSRCARLHTHISFFFFIEKSLEWAFYSALILLRFSRIFSTKGFYHNMCIGWHLSWLELWFW